MLVCAPIELVYRLIYNDEVVRQTPMCVNLRAKDFRGEGLSPRDLVRVAQHEVLG